MVEEWKWRGVPVWSHAGMICTGETSKNVVKMTFAKGASLEDSFRPLQLEPRGQHQARNRHPRGRSDRRGRVQSVDPRGREPERVVGPRNEKETERRITSLERRVEDRVPSPSNRARGSQLSR